MIDYRSHTYLIKWLPPEVNVIYVVGRGTHHVIKCTDENTPTRNYNLRSMRTWRREKAWFRGYIVYVYVYKLLSTGQF